MNEVKKIIGEYCYFISNRLGDGVSSEVYAGFHLQTKQQVAIKVIPKAPHCRYGNLSMAEAEMQVLQQLTGRPHILQLYYTTQTKNNIYIVTQLCQKGSLSDVIKHHSKLPEAQALKYLKQLVEGYKAISDQQLIHRDIKPQNILIDAQGELFIGDFGLCIKAYTQDSSQGAVGSPFYMAPEIINPNESSKIKYTFQSDIWAIGLTFYEMLRGRAPWRAKNENDLAKSIRTFDINRHLPTGLGRQSQQFLRRSLCIDPDKRMSLEELFEFFEDQQVDKISQEKVNQITKPETFRPSSSKRDEGAEKDNAIPSYQGQNLGKIQEKAAYSTLQTEFSLERIKKQQRMAISRINLKPNNKELKRMLPPNIIVQTHKKYRRPSFQGSYIEVPIKAKTDAKIRKHSEQINCQEVSQFTHHEKGTGKTLEELLTDLQSPKVKLSSASTEEILLTGDQSDAQAGILLQLQGQINYMRLILKIWRKIQEALRIDDKGILSFKSSLLYLFSSSLGSARSLSQIKGFTEAQLSQFKESRYCQSLTVLLERYEKKYVRQVESSALLPDYRGDNNFLKLLSYMTNILYRNIIAIEKNSEELNRKRILIFILEDLIYLAKAFLLGKRENWQDINKKLSLSLYLKERGPERITSEYWQGVRDRFLDLTRSRQA